ncbi:MAG: 2OG-Fe(II) oxygenase [Xanthomonadales bacterium]|nr:2OG-Fe(II) oxygenase [Xanthomonadales bacterium]
MELDAVLHPEVLARRQDLATAFQRRDPFRNVVIEPFFRPEFAQALVDEFPKFDEAAAINEDGRVGGKSTQERVAGLGPSYRTLDRLARSKPFLSLVSTITGIPELFYDPHYFGGGTHENRHGQDLDPHVDFNYHPITGQHRRLNLIVYLNPEWEESWGGCLDLHRDPSLPPEEDEIKRVAPVFNRGVIFETTEWSWHGFERINLPEDRRYLSRKSFALYYYTRTRPESELGKSHSTIYVERHLPDHIRAGRVLSEDDVEQIRTLLTRRDQHLKRLYRHISILDDKLAAVRGSVLWRLAKPLRMVERLLRSQSPRRR